MKFVAAYLLASMGGNPSPTRDDVRGILDSVGAQVEEDKMEMLFKAVEGKDVTELIAAGREKLAFAPCGGAAVNAVAPTVAAAGGAGGAAEEEEKVEEKAEEEDNDAMFSLFDD